MKVVLHAEDKRFIASWAKNFLVPCTYRRSIFKHRVSHVLSLVKLFEGVGLLFRSGSFIEIGLAVTSPETGFAGGKAGAVKTFPDLPRLACSSFEKKRLAADRADELRHNSRCPWFWLAGLPVIVGKKNIFAVCMALTVVAGPIRVPLFFFAVKRLVADGAGKFRRDGLFTGSAGFAVVVRKKGVAVGIGAGPEESPVLLVRTLAHGLAALRAGENAREEGDRQGKNRIEECGQDRDLVLHEGVKREFTTGDLFEPLFPLCRHHRVFEHTRSHVDERLAKRR